MSDTLGAVGQHIREYVGYEPDGSFGDPQLAAWADTHDAEDARRDNELAMAKDQWLEYRNAYDAATAVIAQARELLNRLLQWDSFHDPAGPWLDWITRWKVSTEDALAAIDALEVRG